METTLKKQEMKTNLPSQGRGSVSVPFLLMAILFNVCLIASNLFETKLFTVAGISLTGGVIIFPVSYIINDCLVEVYGYRKSRLVIWSGFVMNFFVVALGLIAVQLPAAPFWEGEAHFNFVFGMAPRIVVGSLLAFLVGSFLNAYVMSKMKLRNQGRYFSLRAIASTLVGETADSLIFFPIAFWGLIGVKELAGMMAAQIVLKSLYEVLVLPLTIRVVKAVKRMEDTDVYDEGVSYSIFFSLKK